MKKGDVILVPFPFSDLSGKKYRPALVLADFNDDIIVAFITSQSKYDGIFDYKVEPSIDNGLKVSSRVRVNQVATLDKSIVRGKLGALHEAELIEINQLLLIVFTIESGTSSK